MRFFYAIALGAVWLSACSHVPKTADLKVPENYQQMLEEKVGAEIIAESNHLRRPANENWQLRSMKAQLGDLNRVKPGKFEIYVFPKMNTSNHMENREDSAVLLGKPQVNEVSVLAVTSCEALIKKNLFSKYNPGSYFDPALSQNKKNQCAIVEVSSVGMKTLNKALLREGDVIAKRIYLDGSYNVYGVETDYYSRDAKQRDLSKKTVGMKLTAGTPATSGLDFLPVDMPALSLVDKLEPVKVDSVFASKAQNSDFTFKSGGAVLDKMAVRQIQRLNRKFNIPKCSLRKIAYKDHFRKNVEMYWCEGMPWPQVVDSLQFVAVTQNISVR